MPEPLTRSDLADGVVGKPPRWWDAALYGEAPLAWGPFAVDFKAEGGPTVTRVATWLRYLEDGLLAYGDTDHTWTLAPSSVVAKGNVVAIVGTDGSRSVIRTLREDDAEAVGFTNDGLGGTLAAKLRRSLGWD